MGMTSHDRWKLAQQHEQQYWERAADRMKQQGKEDLSWYKWRAGNLKNLVSLAFPDRPVSLEEAVVVEVGSGPVGVVAFLEGRERYAVDPLCDYYSTRPELIEYRSPEVKYSPTRGESLDFSDKSVDLVIMENVIDHVENADQVMQQIHRILKPNAIFFFTVNLHPRWGAMLHRLVSAARIDKCHPHTFTLGRIRTFLNRHGFAIAHEQWQDYATCRREDLRSPSLKDKLKGLSGLSEYLYTAVLQRR